MSFDQGAFELAEAIESMQHEYLGEAQTRDFDSWDELAEEEYIDDLLDEEEPLLYEHATDMEEVLRGALAEDYVEATPEDMEEALFNVLESLSPAESFNFSKAFSQIEKGAARALADPTVAQIAKTALPVAGGAAGTLVGGPAGTAIGSGLGSAAAKALPAGPKASPSTPAITMAVSPSALASTSGKTPVAGGSAAAAQGLALTQQPEVLKSLLALALGEHGRKSVNGVPVGAVMNMLSTVFGQAASDADELLYVSTEAPAYLLDGEGHLDADPVAPTDRAQALYSTLLNAESEHLVEAVGWDEWS